jgi:hypothetical protein
VFYYHYYLSLTPLPLIIITKTKLYQAAYIRRMNATSLTTSSRIGLKRKVGYDQEEEEKGIKDARKAIVNMSMNDET